MNSLVCVIICFFYFECNIAGIIPNGAISIEPVVETGFDRTEVATVGSNPAIRISVLTNAIACTDPIASIVATICPN